MLYSRTQSSFVIILLVIASVLFVFLLGQEVVLQSDHQGSIATRGWVEKRNFGIKISKRYLKFAVCNGITNQVLAFEDAVLLAKILDATLILPRFLSEYTLKEPDMDFEEIFSKHALVTGLQDRVRIASPSKELEDAIHDRPVVHLVLTPGMKKANVLKNLVYSHPNASTGSFTVIANCPLFSVDARDNRDLLSLRWKVFDSLVLRQELEELKERMIAKVGPIFNALHLRLEDDWMAHCKTWRNPWANNCDFPESFLSGSSVLERLFEIEGIDPNVPLYVATGLTRREICKHASVGENFCKKYHLIFKGDVLDEQEFSKFKKPTPCRDLYAALEYSVISSSRIFIGNSVSTFAALQMLQRKSSGRPFLQYNGGDIPLENYLGQIQSKKPLKWIFSYAVGSLEEVFDHVKVAVMSAKLNTDLVPYCLTNGDDQVTEWLRLNNVHVIMQKLKWNKHLEKIQSNTTAEAAYQLLARIDFPIHGWMDEYILYTDTDVMFLSDVKLQHFGKNPKYFMCGPETGRCDSGVMLFNVLNMINSYAEFSTFILKNPTGREFKNGQSALFEYYADKFSSSLPKHLNWKPYWSDWKKNRKAVRIVHMHGRKISDFEHVLGKESLKSDVSGLREQCNMKTSSCKAVTSLFKWVLRLKTLTRCDAASMRYLLMNNDVLYSGININAWEHFKTRGQAEGRKWHGAPCE